MPDLSPLDWPLMDNNITIDDLDAAITFLRGNPILTQSAQVCGFEQDWSDWLGVKYSVFVNSGSSANLLTIAALKEMYGTGEVIVPPLTWSSDIASLIHCGMTPVFADISRRTLGMDTQAILDKITPHTKALFLTHILGFNALTENLLGELRRRNIPLIEDVCESHGATFQGKKLGTFGAVSNFSFYYAHHLSTVEGGMICTDDPDLYEIVRMLRGHGMVREATSAAVKADYATKHPDLTPDFTFAYPGWNARNTEFNAVIGRSGLPRLDANIVRRQENFTLFLSLLDPARYDTDFATEGSSNYAFTLVLREKDEAMRDRAMAKMRELNVEFRRGTSGGGNQLRQPYLRRLFGDLYRQYPVTDHIHFFGFYIGNYPGLDHEKIRILCSHLNRV